jgi:hypothetical protein
MEDMHDTWIKPHVLQEYLEKYKFVIFIDADATIQHLELPLEWLFNRWNIREDTSIAMPIDTRQILNGNNNTSCDSKGKIALNTGFIVAQALPLTMEMMEAWKTCPDGKTYPECGTWANNWSHEQRAFSEYIRYDFNKTKNTIVVSGYFPIWGIPDPPPPNLVPTFHILRTPPTYSPNISSTYNVS